MSSFCTKNASQIVQFLAYTAHNAGLSKGRVLRLLYMASHSSPKRAHVAAQVIIPDRLYFKIGDVAEICGLETYVLRFWETQFPQLKPNKSGTGQRLYRRRDVELVLEIKRLVHGEGYTLAGARQALSETTGRRAEKAVQPEAAVARPAEHVASMIRGACAELREIADMLAAPEPTPIRRRSRVAPIAPPHTDLLFPS